MPEHRSTPCREAGIKASHRACSVPRLRGGMLLAGALVVLAAGCLHLPPDQLYLFRLTPAPDALTPPAYYADPQDSTAVFAVEGFRLKLRFFTDAQLNQEYARETFRQPNLNPFTYGTDRDLDLGYSPPRFTVLALTVVNQSFPKVQVDPARITLTTDRGDRYTCWEVLKRDGPQSFEAYYQERRGQGGNEDYYYQQRLGVVREALFRRHTWVFQGQSYTGKVVFLPLHPQVRQVDLQLDGIVLRVDAFDRPTRTEQAHFRFNVDQQVVRRQGSSTAPTEAKPDSTTKP